MTTPHTHKPRIHSEEVWRGVASVPGSLATPPAAEQPWVLSELQWAEPDGSPSRVANLAETPAVPARWPTTERYAQDNYYGDGGAGVTQILHGVMESAPSRQAGDGQRHGSVYGIVEVRKAVGYTPGRDGSHFVLVEFDRGPSETGAAQPPRIVGTIGAEPLVAGRDPYVHGAESRRQFGVSIQAGPNGQTEFEVRHLGDGIPTFVHRPNPNTSAQSREQAWQRWQLPFDQALALRPNSMRPMPRAQETDGQPIQDVITTLHGDQAEHTANANTGLPRMSRREMRETRGIDAAPHVVVALGSEAEGVAPKLVYVLDRQPAGTHDEAPLYPGGPPVSERYAVVDGEFMDAALAGMRPGNPVSLAEYVAKQGGAGVIVAGEATGKPVTLGRLTWNAQFGNSTGLSDVSGPHLRIGFPGNGDIRFELLDATNTATIYEQDGMRPGAVAATAGRTALGDIWANP